MRPIVNKYREGKLKSTLKRESNLGRETDCREIGRNSKCVHRIVVQHRLLKKIFVTLSVILFIIGGWFILS